MTRIRILIALFATALAGSALGDEPAPDGFTAAVAPILVRHCLGCHNDAKSSSGLNMKTFALLRKGGKTSGADVLKPGDPDGSELIAVVRPEANPRMPLKQAPLSDAEIAALERWVKAGAKFDGPNETETPLASLVDPLKGLPEVAVTVPAADAVTAVAYAPGGEIVAAARGRAVHLFQASDGAPKGTLPGHPGTVSAVRFTPDGKSLVAVGGRPGRFGSVVVWDVASKTITHDLRGHADSVLNAALAPDGRTLATAGYDRLIKLWDVVEGKEIRTLKEHTDAVHGIAFSPNGRSLASAAADRTIKVWDVATGRRRVTMSEATGEQYTVRFSPDGREVLGAGVDRTIRVWLVEGDTARLVRSAIAHDAPVLRLVVAADGKTLVSAGEDKAIKLWDLASLSPRAALPTEPDWPLDIAVSPDGSRLASARYDGSLAILELPGGKALATPLSAPGVAAKPAAEPAAKPQLVSNASLAPPSPRGGVRGTTITATISGNGVERADAVVFMDPGVDAEIVVPADGKPTGNSRQVKLTIAADAEPRVQRFAVRTPLGVPATQPFAVSVDPELSETEPNDSADKATAAKLPATLLGAIDKPGDVDLYRFEALAGRVLVFDTLARPLGSALDGTLAVLGATGRVLAEAGEAEGGRDPLLVFTPPADGVYFLRVGDAEYGGSGNHFYRISAGVLPRMASVFPLGVSPGSEASITLEGANIDGLGPVTLKVPAEAEPGSELTVRAAMPDGSPVRNPRRVIVAAGAQGVETAGNDSVEQASPLATPGGASGRIEKPGDVDCFRFAAKKGRPVVLEVFARRLGSPVDTAIEVLDTAGHAVPRAVLRPVAETQVAFRDHPAIGRNIRLTHWEEFAEGDYVLVGRELMRIFELPRNPDDDSVMWGLGNARNNTGERIAFLGTTPEHHPQAQPIYKVEIHPPGSTFAPGGVAPVTLTYRNDDAGQGIGKDSKLTFDPPADGEYIVRVEDVRGLGGNDFGYHLVAREPKPDFAVMLSSENLNVPRGGTAIVTATIGRLDGFEGPVDISLEDLPAGVSATPVRVEPEVYAADLVVMADESAPAVSDPTWKVVGRARVGDREIARTLDPGGRLTGWVTVTPPPNLKIGFQPETITLRPGQTTTLTLTVERSPAFTGRVPIDVRNLPRGVQVQNIGLNGVLVTEKETSRTISIRAEPWAAPQERPFFAVANCEAAGTQHASRPIRLIVAPASIGAAAAR